jgi:hypothetical protein
MQDYAVTIPSANNAPNPTGTPNDPNQPNPTPDNPWLCTYTDDYTGTVQVELLWDGNGFSLTDAEANDNNFGTVSFTYDPPLV